MLLVAKNPDRAFRALSLFVFAAAIAGSPARAQSDAPPTLQTNSSQFIELMPRPETPPAMLDRLDGKSIPIASFRKKVVLLSFWATWCPPCRRELPSLERLKGFADPRKLEIAAVSVDKADKVSIERFLKNLDVKRLPIYLDPRGVVAGRADQETKTPFQLYGMPISYLIDRDGSVVGYITGEVDWTSPDALSFLGRFTDR